MKCTVKKVNITYKMEAFNKLYDEVQNGKKKMKAMQLHELLDATETKRRRTEIPANGGEKSNEGPGEDKKKKKAKKGEENVNTSTVQTNGKTSKIVPDVKDYSPIFQAKFEELAMKTSKFNELRENIKNNPGEHALSICFITFQTKQIADAVEKYWGFTFDFSISNLLKLFSSNKYYTSNRNNTSVQVPIRVSRAPDPNDVIFINLGLSNSSAITRRVLTYIATIFLLGISFGATIGLKILQNTLNKNSAASTNTVVFRLISVGITVIISIINYIMSKTIRSLTFAEKHWTKTAFYQSLTIKIVIAHLINTSVLIVLIHIIVFKPVDAIYAKGAILSDAMFMLINLAILSPLLVFFDPWNYVRAWKRNSLKKKIQNGEAGDITQETAHKAFEEGEFDPSFAYASFANILFTSVFFQPILPISGLTGLLALVLNYYAYKKKLLRDSKRPVMVSDDIAEVTLYLLNIIPFAWGLSTVIFDKILVGKVAGEHATILAVGIISIFYPLYLLFLNTFKDCFNKKNVTEINLTVDYDEMRVRFLNEYDRANPVTKEDAMAEYFKFMRGKLFSDPRKGH